MNDVFSTMESIVRVDPQTNVRFLAEELRRYGIKTNKKNERGKILFYQSAHLIQTFNVESKSSAAVYPSYAIVSFKDLFKLIGKNDEGVDGQDIVRVWVIAEKLEKRKIVTITGTATQTLGKDDEPVLPNVYANLHHIHRNDEHFGDYSYRSKFASNKQYETVDGHKLLGVSDHFVVIE